MTHTRPAMTTAAKMIPERMEPGDQPSVCLTTNSANTVAQYPPGVNQPEEAFWPGMYATTADRWYPKTTSSARAVVRGSTRHQTRWTKASTKSSRSSLGRRRRSLCAPRYKWRPKRCHVRHAVRQTRTPTATAKNAGPGSLRERFPSLRVPRSKPQPVFALPWQSRRCSSVSC